MLAKRPLYFLSKETATNTTHQCTKIAKLWKEKHRIQFSGLQKIFIYFILSNDFMTKETSPAETNDTLQASIMCQESLNFILFMNSIITSKDKMWHNLILPVL